jgi:hypothetical protein
MSEEMSRIEALEARIAALEAKPAAKPAAAASPRAEVASDEDLDSPFGNYVVKKNPPRWNAGADGDYAGKTLSECSAEFLDSLAGFNDWRAKKDDEAGEKDTKGRPKSYFAKRDAARCRGWAKRVRGGAVPAPVPAETQAPLGDDPLDDEGLLPF